MAVSVAPLVLFLGPEEGEKRAAVHELRQALRARHGDGLEEHRFYAFETSADQVVAVLETGSLFGSGALVIYRAVEHLKRPGDVAALKAYAGRPNGDAVLVLESTETAVPKAVRDLVPKASTRIFWEMFDNQKHGWLTGLVRRSGGSADAEAIELLLELVPNNTWELRQAVERLLAFTNGELTADVVDAHLSHARAETPFGLFDAIVAADLDHALDITHRLLAESDAAQIAGALAWQVERVHQAHTLVADGVGAADLPAAMKERFGASVAGKRAAQGLRDAMRAIPAAACMELRRTTLEFDAALRELPGTAHRLLTEMYVYSAIVTRGAWRLGLGAIPRPAPDRYPSLP